MLHQPHPGITRPALLIVVTHNVLVVGVRVLCQIPLNQVPGLISRESRATKTVTSLKCVKTNKQTSEKMSSYHLVQSYLKKMWMRSM